MKSSAVALPLLLLALAACTSLFRAQPLRVGITPDHPPYLVMKDGVPAGVEADLAQALGRALGRPVEFVKLREAERIPALVVNEVDILMSGLVPARSFRHVTFTAPYSTNGPRVWAVRAANPDMLARVNKQLAVWYADGTINRILQQSGLPPTAPAHLPAPPPPPVVTSNTAPAALQPHVDARNRPVH